MCKVVRVNKTVLTDPSQWTELATDVLRIEAQAVLSLESRLGDEFVEACRLLLATEGRVVVCGVGKSGHIGHKIAATLASTGTPSFFLHAAEAMHGDLGMLRRGDVVIAISQSGTSGELLSLLPGLKHLGCPVISMSGNPNSPLVEAATVALDVSVEREACPLGLAPTASTTATLALGDALAIALLGARGFNAQDFARSHPGGRLGRRLLVRVSEIMASGSNLPIVPPTEQLTQALLEMSAKGLGMVAVCENETLQGVFTDGDLRRAIDRGADVQTAVVEDVMTTNPLTTSPDTLAFDAISLMRERKITSLPVLDDTQLTGVITMHQLLQSGVV